MSMQSIRIGVVRDRRYRAGDGFHVFGDGGSGEIDWVRPVTPRRVLLWEDAPSMPGHLQSGHLMTPHLDSVRPDGHVEGTHLMDSHLRPAAAVACEVGRFVFGRFRHAVVMEDEIGNRAAGTAVHETVINSEPEPAMDLVPVGQDEQTRRMEFSFTPSERLTG